MSNITRGIIETSNGGVMPWWMVLLFFVGIPILAVGIGIIIAVVAMPRSTP